MYLKQISYSFYEIRSYYEFESDFANRYGKNLVKSDCLSTFHYY